MAACAVLGVVIERFAYRPLRDAPRIAPLISALGVSFFLSYSVQLLFGANHRTYDTFNMAGGKLYEPAITIGSFSISWLRVIGIVAAVVLMFGSGSSSTGRASARPCGRRRSIATPPR